MRLWKAAAPEGMPRVKCRLSPLFAVPITGHVNALQFTDDGRYLLAAVGRAHRFGRWNVVKEAKNGLYVIDLLSNTLKQESNDEQEE